MGVVAASALSLVACGNVDGDGGNEALSAVSSAVTACTVAAPVVTQVKEEQPGPVAPGTSKVYFVTASNADSTGCAPSTFSFVPDSFHLFSIVAQPNNVGGVSPGATVQFRVTVTSDPSVAPGTYAIGFTIVNNAGAAGSTSVRGSLTYVATFTNPTGCNRQPVQLAIDNADPAAVAPGTTVTYHVTARNIDNPACGQDTFTLTPNPPPAGVTVATNGPFAIAAQSGSAVFTLTIHAVEPAGSTLQECFTVAGAEHPAPSLDGTGCVRYRTR
jgi:hypothetical protein